MTEDKQTTFEFEARPTIKGFPELHWTGKRPYRSTQYFPAQIKERHGSEVNGWINKIFWGDNLQVMSHLLKEYRGKVDLIYIDPPFDSDADYKKIISLKGQKIQNDSSTFEEKQYGDIWTNDEYLQFMYERLILMRELLSPNGIFALHCDWHQSCYLRCVADDIFGQKAFQNEIIWHYYNKMQGNIHRFASNHDNILVYAKGSKYTFNQQRELRDKPEKQIKRIWDSQSQKLVNAKDEDGKVIYIESTEKTIDDVWRLSMLQPADKKEPVGYPTQKPETVISRIISAFSNPGDLVFDCFMGSGTTQAVAMKLGRRFIGADINLGAIQTTTKRLLGVAKELNSVQKTLESEDEADVKYTGFEVYNVNNYDIFRNPVEAKELLLEAYQVQKYDSSSVYDGELDGWMVKLMPVNRIATKADLEGFVANLPYKTFEIRKADSPNSPVERIRFICMGHEPDLAAAFKAKVPNYKIDVEVVDVMRDSKDLHFKHDSDAKIVRDGDNLVIEEFYPLNLMQKLSWMEDDVTDWRQLVESVMIDWNYDGAVMEPKVTDIPEKADLVKGVYPIPEDFGVIKIKITDLLSESYEEELRW